jgi:outer membrane protein assembly factor BamB
MAGAEFARRAMSLRELSRADRNTTSPSQGPKWLWRLPVSPIVGDRAVSIIVADDTVYLLSYTAVHALAADSGRTIWKYPLSNSWPNSLSLNEGIIYLISFSTDINNNNTYLTALNVRTGRRLWHRTAINAGLIGPVCDGQVIYLGTSPLSNETGYLYALDALNGKLIWQLSGVGDSQTLVGGNNTSTVVTRADVPVFLTDDILYTASNLELHARNKNTGEEVWTFSYPGFGNNGGPIQSQDRIYVSSSIDPSGSTSQMIAINAETGQQVWSSSVLGGSFSIDVTGGTVFALAAENGVSALAAASGSTTWAWTSPSLSPFSSVANDVVLVSIPPNNLDGGVVRPGGISGETELRALRSSDGQPSWEIVAAGSSLTSAPVLVGDWACVGFSQKSIRVLDAITGRTRWDLPTPVEYGPIVSGDILFAIVADDASETGNASLSGMLCGIEI